MFRWKRPIDRELFCYILSSYLGFVSFFLDRQKKNVCTFSISKTGEVHRADKEIISDRKQEKEKNLERQKKNLVSGFTLCWCRQQVTLSSNNHLTNRTFERKSPSTRIHMLPDQSNGGRILHTASLCSLPSVCICCVCGCVRVCLLQCVRPRSWVVHVCVQALCFFLPQYELETLSVCEYIASSPVFKFMYPTVELATLFSRVYFVFPCSIFVFLFFSYIHFRRRR